MNEHLKFRAWDGKRFHEWGYIDNGFGIIFVSPPAPHYVSQQFTGLQDKNGKDIYVGDIIQGYQYNPLSIFIVKFLADKFSCAFVASEPTESGYINIWYEGLEVIGNIFETSRTY